MSAGAILAGLLRQALPACRLLDLGLPAAPLLPWWPGALCGLAEPASLPPAEAALLGRFRHGPLRLPVFGLDPAQMALAFVNSRAFVTSNIIGATSMEQLRTDIASIDIKLSPEVEAKIDAIHQLVGNPCP